jgi:hypothetical protein
MNPSAASEYPHAFSTAAPSRISIAAIRPRRALYDRGGYIPEKAASFFASSYLV